jgi:hypothetical protein
MDTVLSMAAKGMVVFSTLICWECEKDGKGRKNAATINPRISNIFAPFF